MIIRPSFTVLSGAAIGLVAGAAVYGAVSTASAATSPAAKPAKAIAAAPAPAARCAADQKLEDGVCIVSVVRTVVVPAPPIAESGGLRAITGADQGVGPSASQDRENEVGEDAHDASEAAEEATDDVTEDAEDTADDDRSELSGPDQGAGESPSDNDISDASRG